MVDLTQYNIEIPKSTAYNSGDDPKQAFYNQLKTYGFDAPPHIVTDKIIKIRDAHNVSKNQNETDGWYWFTVFEDDARNMPIGIGVFASFHGNPERTVWCSKKEHHFTEAERERYKAKMEASKAAHEEHIKQINDAGKQEAQRLWSEAVDVVNHGYLQKKKIKTHGLKQKNEYLLVPIYENNEIVNLQRIWPDGTKRFLKGGKIKGCYGVIRGGEDCYICEGYSTGASIHEATGATVYIAFNAGNLFSAISNINNRPLIIAADNDFKSEINVGIKNAQQASAAYGLDVVIPKDGFVDFNDMHVDKGLGDVKRALEQEPAMIKPDIVNDPRVPEPTGALADIAAYYNATSGNNQPLFALQTALAVGSLICARTYVSNVENYTSMYFLNIAKSGTGKEHSKTVIQRILDAAGCDHLLVGEGYTSKGAVMSALLGKPRHITIIDEFGKYLESAKRGGNQLQADVNTQLMQAISGVSSKMYSQVYSSMTQKEKGSSADFVHRPAITLMGMTTPSTFFKSLDIGAINDGFLNRFIIAMSDAPRTVREHKDFIDVPESITRWIEAIDSRRPDVELAKQKPDQVVLDFTDKAIEVQKDFQKYCIDIADRLEKNDMSEISGRSNEMAMRIALICALSDDPEAKIIEEKHMKWGVEYVKYHLDRLIDVVKMEVSGSEYEQYKKEIWSEIKKRGEISLRDMNRTSPFSKHKAKDLKEILSNLIEGEFITETTEPPKGGRGRPSLIYKSLR